MNKILKNIQYIKVYDLLSPFIFIVLLLPAIIFKIYNKIIKRKLLLISENGKTARDNGFHLYRYIRKKHSSDYCFYVIDRNKEDYIKVKKYGNIIQYRSIRHWLYYLSADYNISNHKDGNPDAPFFYVMHVVLKMFDNRVFLQHGITKDDAEWLYYKNCRFRYFICGAKREYKFIKEKFGYPEDRVVYTGFPRFDNLYGNKIIKNQVLIMPTWRNWLGRETNLFGELIEFEKTDYYKNWNSLLNNDIFIDFIEKNNINVIFYPHINMQKYLDKFIVRSKNIHTASTKLDIQKVLKESALMITDYSSVYMDFAYMGKPVIYFHFDYDEYRSKQYQDGYFDYKKDGFGPVCLNVNNTVNEIINYYENGMGKEYYDRMKDFFELKDQSNCERVYNLLK